MNNQDFESQLKLMRKYLDAKTNKERKKISSELDSFPNKKLTETIKKLKKANNE